MTDGRGRIVVVSHPNVVPHNQRIYVRLSELGWDVKLIVPNRWVDAYTPDGFTPQADACFTGTFARVRVARPGVIQRHFYVTRPSRCVSDSDSPVPATSMASSKKSKPR